MTETSSSTTARNCGAAGRIVGAAVASLPHVSVLLVDAALRIQAVLGAAMQARGYDTTEIVGHRLDEIVPADAVVRIEALYRRALRGETVVDVAETIDGTSVYETTYGPALDGTEIVGAVAVSRDVTVEQRALAELAATDALHRTVMSNVSDVLALTDVADGRCSWVSPSSAWVLGWRPEDVTGTSIFDYIHPDDLEETLRRRAELQTGAEQIVATYRFRRPDGTWLWVESKVRSVQDGSGSSPRLLATVRDITERLRLQTELSQAQETFELSFAGAPIGMALVGLDGRFMKVNHALCTLLARDEQALLAATFQGLTHPDDLAADVALVQETVDGARDGYRMEKRYLRPDGTVVWVLLAVSVVRDTERRPRFFISQIEDITGRKNALHEMERLATTDHLTGLPNRLLLMDRLRHALALARRGGWLVGVIFIDLDRFKDVNDTHGHELGDDLLRQVADRLALVTSEGDTATRLGGDEFVVVCDQVATTDTVQTLAERIRAELSRPFTLFGHDVQITASVGVATGNTATAEALLRDADRSMYSAKHGHHREIDVYSEALEVLARDQLTLHAELHDGIGRGELTVFYQPIVELGTGNVVAREALVRWQHPTRGLLQPASFLEGTDRSRLGIMLGENVLWQACNAALSWPGATAVHVNISARHLTDPGLAGFVHACLRATGLAADRLVLEITESLVLTASSSSLTSARALTEMGVGLSLDDFGTGYSSVTALHRLPIDSIKIDRSFIADTPHNPASAALVEGLISLGSHMDLDVIAEGVETAEQSEWLTSRGCAQAQGFFFGHPSPAA